MNPNVRALLDDLTMLSPLILLFGIGLGLFFFSKLEKVHRILLLYLIAAFVVDILSRVLAEFYNNNLILIPIFGLLELLILSWLFFKYLLEVQSKWWYVLIGLLVIFNLKEIIFLMDVKPKDFYCHSRVLDSLVIAVMSLVFFIRQINFDDQGKRGFLLLSTIIFAFHSINLILYLPINFLINETSNIKFHFWGLSLVLTLIFYISIIRVLWIHGKNLKP